MRQSKVKTIFLGKASYPPRAVANNFTAPHDPRLASSKASISDNGRSDCLNQIHLDWESPLEIPTDMVAFAMVANKAMRALSVISYGHSGKERPLYRANTPMMAATAANPTTSANISAVQDPDWDTLVFRPDRRPSVSDGTTVVFVDELHFGVCFLVRELFVEVVSCGSNRMSWNSS